MKERVILFRAFQDHLMIYQEKTGVAFQRQFLNKLYCDTELMQFTGLNDKNGKPIYEGDIVEFRGKYKTKIIDNKKVKSPYFSYEVISYEQGGFKKSIVKQENSWFGELPSPAYQITESISSGKVIGNIHQHPHLIK